MTKTLRLLLLLLLLALPVAAQTAPGNVQPDVPGGVGNLQNAVTTNGNGSAVNVQGFGAAIIVVTLTGTGTPVVSFKSRALSSGSYAARYGYLKTDSTKTLVATTSTSGEYYIDCAGDYDVIAVVSGTWSGTVTVTIKRVPATARVGAPSGGGSTSLAIGTTPITGGTTTRVLFDNAGVVGEDADLSFLTDTLTVTKAVIGGGSAITSSGPGGALTALGFTSPGTGVATALGVNVGSAGAVVVNGGALGSPSSGVATNLTGLPLTTGVTGVLPAANGGTGVANNAASTITISGNFGTTFTVTGTTGVTLPTSGTLLTTAGSGAGLSGIPTSITGTANQVTASAGTGAVTLSLPTDLKIAAIFPASDSTTAFKINKANDSTAVVTVDTTNARVGINKTPGAFDLDVNGAVNFATSLAVGAVASIGATGSIRSELAGTTAFIAGNNAGGFYVNGRWQLSGPADGVFLIRNDAGNDFGRIQLGGTTNSFNAIARDAVNGFTLQSAAATATWNDPSTANSGTVANRYLFGIAAPTLTATGTSVTDTVASTVYIGGAPTASTNTTIGTAWALLVAAGGSKLNGTVFIPNITASSSVQTAVLCQSSSGEMIADSVACLASSGRFKQDIKPLAVGLDEVMRLRPVSYRYKPEGIFSHNANYLRERVGFIAESVATVDERFVGYEADGKTVRTVSYETMVPLLVKSIQELKGDVDMLKAEIQSLKQPRRIAFQMPLIVGL